MGVNNSHPTEPKRNWKIILSAVSMLIICPYFVYYSVVDIVENDNVWAIAPMLFFLFFLGCALYIMVVKKGGNLFLRK